MATNDLISVIIPVYNVEHYLDACIQSVYDQTYTNIQIIIINDGSTDGSLAISQKWSLIDSRILLFDQENGGLSSARNKGLDESSGDYICFIDSDDVIHVDFIKILHESVSKSGADMATCHYKEFFDHEHVDLHSPLPPVSQSHTGDYFLNHLYTDGYFPLHIIAVNKIYKKSIWNGLRFPSGKIHEDEYVIHHIYAKAHVVVVVENALYFYRQRSNSIMGNFSKKRFDDILNLYLERLAFFKLRQQFDLIERTKIAELKTMANLFLQTDHVLLKRYMMDHLLQLIFGNHVPVKLKISVLIKLVSARFYHFYLRARN